MALQFVTALRNNRLAEITALVDAGSGAGFLRIYDGTQPATGGTATTLLAELTFSDPSFAAPSSGQIIGNSITADASANATGTATWFRVTDSDGNAVMDAPIADLNLNTTSITSGVQVSCSQFDITEGNP